MGKKPVYLYNEEIVDIENILIDDEEGFRFSMFIPFNESTNKNHAVVIMRNPSKADQSKSDKTINNVLRFCKSYYSGVFIANLYPYYETDSTMLKNFIESSSYEVKMQRNYDAIDKILDKVDDAIVAWGTNNTGHKYNNEYENNIKLILDKLTKAKKNIFAIRFTSSKNPWHPRNWEESFNLETYPWSNNT
jgi:hypothetical protein